MPHVFAFNWKPTGRKNRPKGWAPTSQKKRGGENDKKPRIDPPPPVSCRCRCRAAKPPFPLGRAAGGHEVALLHPLLCGEPRRLLRLPRRLAAAGSSPDLGAGVGGGQGRGGGGRVWGVEWGWGVGWGRLKYTKTSKSLPLLCGSRLPCMEGNTHPQSQEVTAEICAHGTQHHFNEHMLQTNQSSCQTPWNASHCHCRVGYWVSLLGNKRLDLNRTWNPQLGMWVVFLEKQKI